MIDDEVKNETVNEEIQNIDLSVFNKKKFSINGDPDKILELDVSDLNVVTRVKEQYPVLAKLADKVSSLSAKVENLSGEELINETADSLKEIDNEMRACVDRIFDSNVSEVCVPSGSMYDPINGQFRYEHLINTLIALYDANLTKEVKKIQQRVSKHTAKYTK